MGCADLLDRMKTNTHPPEDVAGVAHVARRGTAGATVKIQENQLRGTCGTCGTEKTRGPDKARILARQKLATVCRELGADLVGALDWYKDDAEELAAVPLGLVRLLVADALQQQFIRPAPASPDQNPVKNPQVNPGLLEDLPLLHEDRQFIRARILGRQNRAALLDGYRAAWMDAAGQEPVPHRKDNVGRRAANQWLLKETDR